MGAATTAEMLLALAISLVVLPLLVWLAGRLYAGAILHTGAKVSMRRALKR
jgi:ABC-2 type transport system permease protein